MFVRRSIVATLALLVVAGCQQKDGTTYAAATAAPGATAPATQGTIRTLTYNVAGLPQGISSSDPIVNMPQISPLLNGYELVLVQEDFWYHTQLAQDALHPHQSMPLSGYSTFVGDGLNRFSNTPFANLTRVRWNDCYGFVSNANDCLSSKGFSYARHEVAPGVTVDVYNLHADAGGESGDIDARALNFAQLAQFILATSADQALIVVGDTNLKASKRPRDGTVLQDFLGTTGLADVGATLPNIPEHLDRVLLRDGAKVKLRPLGWRVADEFVDPNGADLSDHEAIHVDVEWRTTP